MAAHAAAAVEKSLAACDSHCSRKVSGGQRELLPPRLLQVSRLGPEPEASYH